MKRLVVAMTTIAALSAAEAARADGSCCGDDGGGDVLWENGNWSTRNGIPHLTDPAYRSVLDDLAVEGPRGWSVGGLGLMFAWSEFSGQPRGSDLEVKIWADRDGRPDFDNLIAVAQNRIYSEEFAGGPCGFGFYCVMDIAVTFDAIVLSPGAYWAEMHVVGPILGGQLISDRVTRSSFWLDWQDYGGRQPGKKLYGTDYDVYFNLYGEEIIPAPGAAVLLAGAALAWPHRRRRRRPPTP